MSVVLGIDIGGTHVRLGLVNKTYELTNFTQLKTAAVFQSSDALIDLHQMIAHYLSEYGLGQEITAISIGFPSTIDKSENVVLSTPNIASLQQVNVVEGLTERCQLPVYINRDVNYLMSFDIHQQKLDPSGVLVGFYFGTGIGNVIFIAGQPLRGKNGVAAELGHVPVLGKDSLCTCGSIGCLENYASGRYLVNLAQQELNGVDVSKIFTTYGDHPKVLEFIENMAITVALEVTLLDPEHLLLGGGILQMAGFPKVLLEERIKARTRKPYPSETLEVIYAKEGQENGVIGAGIYAYQQQVKTKGAKSI